MKKETFFYINFYKISFLLSFLPPLLLSLHIIFLFCCLLKSLNCSIFSSFFFLLLSRFDLQVFMDFLVVTLEELSRTLFVVAVYERKHRSVHWYVKFICQHSLKICQKKYATRIRNHKIIKITEFSFNFQLSSFPFFLLRSITNSTTTTTNKKDKIKKEKNMRIKVSTNISFCLYLNFLESFSKWFFLFFFLC